MVRVWAIVGLTAAILALLAATADARYVPPGLDQVVTSAHFVVHYASATVSAAEVQEVDTDAENAYSLYIGQWGHPVPVDDGDGHTDVYMTSDASIAGGDAAGAAIADTSATQTSASILLDPASANGNPYLVSHEFFHVVQFGMYAYSPSWEAEGSAEWAGGHAANSQSYGNYGDWSVPLDCRPAGCDNVNARARSQFFEFLSERFGPHLLAEAYLDAHAMAVAQGSDQPFDISSLNQALAAHGSSLSAAFDQFAIATLWGDFTAPGIQGVRTDSPTMPILTVPSASGVLPDQTASVDHLAVRYISYRSSETPKFCAPGTLQLQITSPPGAAAAPAVSLNGGAPLTLSIAGAVASVSAPWSTCGSEAIVALPNESTTVDGEAFTVHASVSVAAVPPPVIHFKIPATLHANRNGKVTLHLTADNPGRLQIEIRSKPYRKTVELGIGDNLVSFTLSPGLRSGRHRLTLTPLSLTGRRGRALTRVVSVRTR
jgi:hypothetical protein